MTPAIRVLVVEDDLLLADAHRQLVGRVAGFEVIAAYRAGRRCGSWPPERST